MAKFVNLVKRQVQWWDLKNNHDKTVMMKHIRLGVVVSEHWDGCQCFCLVADPDGLLIIKSATDLQLVNQPVTSP